MKVFHAFDDLIENVSIVNVLQYFLSNRIVEIRFDKFENQIQIFVILSLEYVMELDDIIVFELRKEHDFAVGTLSVSGVLESIENLFKRKYLSSFFIWDLPDVSVGATSDFFEQLILCQDVRFYLICHKRVEKINFEF